MIFTGLLIFFFLRRLFFSEEDFLFLGVPVLVLKFDFDLCFTFFLFPRKMHLIPQMLWQLIFSRNVFWAMAAWRDSTECQSGKDMIFSSCSSCNSTKRSFLRNGGTGKWRKQTRKILTQQCFGSRGKNANEEIFVMVWMILNGRTDGLIPQSVMQGRSAITKN